MRESNRVKFEKYEGTNYIPAVGSVVTFADGHLGGCSIYGDPCTELPKMWKYLLDTLNIKSVVDVGCGFGFHTKYFKEELGCEVLGIEGSSKVVELSLLPDDIICHDYATGAYVLPKTYDMVWCIECVEHIHEQFIPNFMETFKKCRYVAMTHGTPGQGGYHHVNCQPMEYWINIMQKNGFSLLVDTTLKCREISKEDNLDFLAWTRDHSPNKPYRGPSADCVSELIKKHNKVWAGEVPWGFYFGMNGLVFKNEAISNFEKLK